MYARVLGIVRCFAVAVTGLAVLAASFAAGAQNQAPELPSGWTHKQPINVATLDGCGGQSARCGGGLPDFETGRHGGRCRDCRATCARPHRAAILGVGRRRLPAAARREDRAPPCLRWPGNRTGRRNARPVHEGRQAACLPRRGDWRQVRRRAGRRTDARSRASQAWQAPMGDAVRAGNRSGRQADLPCRRASTR